MKENKNLTITKENIEQVYIIENLSKKDTAHRLGISNATIDKLLKQYNIHKSKELIYASVRVKNKQLYGENYAKNRSNKAKETKFEKYGDANYNNRDKCKVTCLEKYGASNPNKTKEVRDKIKNTCLKKYGVSTALNNKDIAKTIREIKLERYGNLNNHEKAVQTNLLKYGVEAPLQNKDIMNKKNKTCQEKYGAPNVFANDEIKYKIKSTVLNKYDVPYACMTKQCRNSSIGNNSSYNISFENLLKKNNISYEREYRINNYSYDFKIDNCLVEIDPSSTHNTLWAWRGHGEPHSIDYHLQKTITAEKNGFRCIHIFDWDNVEKIIQMFKPKTKIYARQCDIKDIDIKEANDFLDKYHLQGKCNGNIINIGLFYKNVLVEVMTFGKPRYNKNYKWELLRLCSNNDYYVIGGASKLFQYFRNSHLDESIISYCDLSKFSGKVYENLGFKLKSTNKPSKHRFYSYKKVHITDNLLRQQGFDRLFDANYGKGTSNEELMIEHGFVPVYDCGQQTWEIK